VSVKLPITMQRFVKKYENKLQRFFEIVPGVLIWVFLLSPLWAGITIPYFVIYLLVILSVYWLYRAALTTVGIAVGYLNFKKSVKTDWAKEIKKLDRASLDSPESLPMDLFPKHLIVIANYGESYEVLSRSIKALTEQNYPLEKIYLAVSIEERKAKKDADYAKRGEYLKKDFGDAFGDRLMFFVHPDNIAGEAIGAAANRTWGTKSAVELLESRGEDISEFLITAPDGDLVFHKEYLGAVAYTWLVSEKRNQKFYQTALYTFNNNYWNVPMLVRILMINLTLPVLASAVIEKHKKETWSCFTLSLQVMKEVDYWDTSLAIDDTTFYWRPYFHFNGDWKCEVFYVPLSADAIYSPSYLKNHVEQYKQYLRWGWGVITVPLAMKTLLTASKINIFTRIAKVYHLFEVFVFWKVLAFLIAFGIPIVLLLNRDLDNYVFVYTVPQTVSTILSMATILLVPTTIFKVLIIPPKPKEMRAWRYIAILLIEAPLNIVALFTFSFIPFIEASTRMMFGQKHATTIKWSEKQISHH
jgi:hypothetical protein